MRDLPNTEADNKKQIGVSDKCFIVVVVVVNVD